MTDGNGSDKNQLLLREHELSNIDEDAFDHSAYVETLEQVIAKSGPPWHIGLFGTWGSGKSSIINLLYERIEKDNPDQKDSNSPQYDFSQTVTARMNAWEHSGESIKTALLLDLNRELDRKIENKKPDAALDDDESLGLLDSDEILHELYDVEEEEEREERDDWEVSKRITSKFKIPIIFLIIIIAITVLLTWLAPSIRIGEAVTVLLSTGILFTMYKTVYLEYKEERDDVQRRMVNPRNDWTGAYKDIYQRILEKAGMKFVDTTGKELEHIVITVDDLDRCESQTVYETLISMKSFMNNDRCTYIVPCDEDALYKHIRAADTGTYLDQRENQHNFLAKFFQTQLRIPELEMDQIQNYMEEKNEALADSLPESIIEDVMVHSGVNTPRRVVQLLNRITTLKLLAEQRAEFQAIDTDENDDILMLAKIAILQEDYPEFYAALEQNEIALETIYREWRSGTDAQGQASVTDIFSSIGVPEDQHSELMTFLIKTRKIDESQDVGPYLQLSGSELSAIERFENAVEQNRIADVEKMANDADQNQAGEYKDLIGRHLNNDDARYQTFHLALETLEEFEDSTSKKEIASALYTVLEEENHEALLAGVDLNVLRPCIERLNETKRVQILRWYVETAVSKDGIEEENLYSILQISPQELEQLYQVQDFFAEKMREALDAGTISKPRYDKILDDVCNDCPQLYSRPLVEGGIV